MTKAQHPQIHDRDSVARAATLFFAVRGLLRTKLAQGRRLDPSAWLRIETLKFIADAGEPTMKDLADYFSITAPSATSLVRRFEREKLVVRKADSRDGRSVRLRLTPLGTKTLREAVNRGMHVLSELFAPLSKRELAAFTRALERIQRGNGA